MKIRLASTVVAALAAIVLVIVSSGTAQASPLLAPPSASMTLSEAPTPGGTVHSTIPKEVKQDLHAATRDEVKFDTGVLRGSELEVGTMNVLAPANPDGTVVAYAPATDSLSPWDTPSYKLDKGSLSDTDIAYINALLDDGKTVLIVNAYGDKNPQYAGTMNGVRIAGGIEAYRQTNPGAPAWCYGFSGGGIDCARIAEYQYAQNIGLVIDSGPTDLLGFLANPRVQNGLGYDAGVGVITSLSAADQQIMFAGMRPSAIVGYKLLRTASDVLPVGQLTTGVMTIGGALLPLPYAVAFRPGALDNPELQRVLRELSPGVRAGGYDATIVERCNSADVFVLCDVHARPFAQQAGAIVITNHGQTAPGHAMMSTEQLLALVNGDIPAADMDTHNEPMSATDKVLDKVLTGAMWGISLYGEWLTEQAPAVLDELDRVVVDADQALDQVITAPAVVTEAVETTVDQGQQLLEEVATPQSEATTVNSETVTQAANDWLAPHESDAVSEFVNSAPVKGVLDNAPVTLPVLPAPGSQVNIGGFNVTVPTLR